MKREIEAKGVLPDSQAGFRKGRGTMDNEERIEEERGRMRALFVDFRAAFDKIDRVKMFECMREKERERERERGRERERNN
jgi:hypothetical protein